MFIYRGTTNIQNAPGKAMGSWDAAYFEVEAASAAPALEGHTMAATSSDNLEMLGRSEEGIHWDCVTIALFSCEEFRSGEPPKSRFRVSGFVD